MEAMQTVTDILAQRAREADNYIISLNNRRLDLAVQDICNFNVHLATRNNKPAEPAAVKPARRRKRGRNLPTLACGTPWTKAEDIRLLELRKLKVIGRDIAKDLGRSESSVTTRESRLKKDARHGI